MPQPVVCSYCNSILDLPRGANYVRCFSCGGVTGIGNPSSLPSCRLPYYSQPQSYYPRSYPAPPQRSYSPPPPLYRQPPPAFRGRKRAVICGISYWGELYGCINDAKDMERLLKTRFDFHESEIVRLTDKDSDPYRPTYDNIINAMTWLVEGCKAGDSLVFHFSGHGEYQKEWVKGDEVDECDELLIPLDFKKKGAIVDDDINQIIVEPLPRGVKLHAIVDTCHSGTILDLPYGCNMDRKGNFIGWEDISGIFKDTAGGKAYCFSACADSQKSAETSYRGLKLTSNGAMTSSFIEAINRGEASTYGSLLDAIRSRVRGIRRTQVPQLSASLEFNVYKKRFSL